MTSGLVARAPSPKRKFAVPMPMVAKMAYQTPRSSFAVPKFLNDWMETRKIPVMITMMKKTWGRVRFSWMSVAARMAATGISRA